MELDAILAELEGVAEYLMGFGINCESAGRRVEACVIRLRAMRGCQPGGPSEIAIPGPGQLGYAPLPNISLDSHCGTCPEAVACVSQERDPGEPCPLPEPPPDACPDCPAEASGVITIDEQEV